MSTKQYFYRNTPIISSPTPPLPTRLHDKVACTSRHCVLLSTTSSCHVFSPEATKQQRTDESEELYTVEHVKTTFFSFCYGKCIMFCLRECGRTITEVNEHIHIDSEHKEVFDTGRQLPFLRKIAYLHRNNELVSVLLYPCWRQ